MTTEINSNDYNYSRRFDVHKWSDYPQVKKLTQELYKELESNETRKKARTSKEAKRLERTLRVVLIDLFVAWTEDKNLYLAYPRGSEKYSDKSRYANIYIKFKAMKNVTDFLCKAGYIDHALGHKFEKQEGRVSRMRATDKLRELFKKHAVRANHITVSKDKELILKKDENKQLIKYDDTNKTDAMRKNVQRINEHLSTFDINLHITNEQEAAIKKKLVEKRVKYGEISKLLNFSSNTLHRVFNNDSFKEGGRFYGAWWHNIPSEFRQHITIDGMPTVELDFSTMHMTMLYAKVDEELEGDAYTLEGYTSEDFASEDYGNGDYGVELRKGVKKLTNAMLNSKDGKIDSRKFEDYAWPNGKKLNDVKNDILERHKPIAKYFNSGEGVKLQYLDSVVAEKVMLKVMERLNIGYHHRSVVLPVHDSFIIPISLLDKHDELMDIMKETFLEVVGLDIEVDVKGGKSNKLGPVKQYEKAYKEEHGLEIWPNARNEDTECGKAYKREYSNYYRRQAEWFCDDTAVEEEKVNVLGRKKERLSANKMKQNYDRWIEAFCKKFTKIKIPPRQW